ncbi:MAG: VWA domain-containing protein [Candidatus Omnitrophota bacterium]|nr:VWA domain-containing protein [Candidatus Omnitrophota bacterium]
MTFQDPWILILLPVTLVFIFHARRKSKPGIKFSSGWFLKSLKPTLKTVLSQNIVFLRAGAIFLMVFALSRPQSPIEESRIRTEGIDIVLAVDCSTSMLAEDFKLGGKRQNRLEAVKNVIKDFIQGRTNDRIGLIAFASRAYTVCPLTLDYGWLLQNLERVKIGMMEDGTAIGSGIGSALNRLKDTKAKGKVIILLTDGRNNAGRISPLTAAEAAKALKAKVYTIGAGTKGLAPYPVKDFFGNTVYQPIKIDIDEDVLIKVASETNAKYFRATDTKSLKEIYKEIDTLEKTPIEEKGYSEYKELFPLFLIPGLALLFMEVILSSTILRRIP